MKTEQEKEAIIEQLDEFFDTASVVDKHDLGVVSIAIIAALVWKIAKICPDDRPLQMRLADFLAKTLRESIERADPDAIALQ